MPCPICDEKPINCQCTEAELRMHYEIEELEEKVPRWIPVSERMPEQGVNVLAYFDGRLYVGYYDGSDWQDDENFRDCEYWMLLPEPPTCP
jgi:hypothetical protein